MFLFYYSTGKREIQLGQKQTTDISFCLLLIQADENNIFRKDELVMKKKLAIFFPGRRYGVDCPLLYYSDLICKGAEYDTMYLHYAAHREEKSEMTIYEDIENAWRYVYERLKDVNVKEYGDIIFVSKSIGTVLASMAQIRLQAQVRNIYFTPLEPTLPYLAEKRLNRPEDNLVIAGTKDRFLEAEKLRKVCNSENIKLKQFEGLGHSMEAEEIMETIEIIKEIIKEVQKFIISFDF